MPPRLQQTIQRFGNLSLCSGPAAKPTTPNFLPITQTANLSMREKKKKQKRDPYAWAQAQQRKNANLQRRQIINEQRYIELGHPIHGKTTPFLESLDSAGQSEFSKVRRNAEGKPLEEPRPLPTTPGMLNYFLTQDELSNLTKDAYSLTKPVAGVVASQLTQSNSQEELDEKHEREHARATEALNRITSMENASGKDRYHANVRRIIDEFGRHKTDQYMTRRPDSINPNPERPTPRAGPDTGSSEVQIAILTAKIRNMTHALQASRGYKDKHNTRNLRLLVHKRQKLLKYMERKERGSERWTHMLEKLGLTPATWKGEITV